MPQIELVEPLSFNTGGVVYKKGEKHEVGLDAALSFVGNRRFKVHGLDKETMARGEQMARPQGETLLSLIRDAADALDVDDDANFDRNGKPAVAAIEKALGHPITVAERDRAMRPANHGMLESAEGKAAIADAKTKPPNVRFKSSTPIVAPVQAEEKIPL